MWIVMEGPDGGGKSSAIEALKKTVAQSCQDHTLTVVKFPTREAEVLWSAANADPKAWETTLAGDLQNTVDMWMEIQGALKCKGNKTRHLVFDRWWLSDRVYMPLRYGIPTVYVEGAVIYGKRESYCEALPDSLYQERVRIENVQMAWPKPDIFCCVNAPPDVLMRRVRDRVKETDAWKPAAWFTEANVAYLARMYDRLTSHLFDLCDAASVHRFGTSVQAAEESPKDIANTLLSAVYSQARYK